MKIVQDDMHQKRKENKRAFENNLYVAALPNNLMLLINTRLPPPRKSLPQLENKKGAVCYPVPTITSSANNQLVNYILHTCGGK